MFSSLPRPYNFLCNIFKKALFSRLKTQEVGDVLVASAAYSVGDEPREIIFFREGSVVFWNCTELEANNVLDFIRP